MPRLTFFLNAPNWKCSLLFQSKPSFCLSTWHLKNCIIFNSLKICINLCKIRLFCAAPKAMGISLTDFSSFMKMSKLTLLMLSSQRGLIWALFYGTRRWYNKKYSTIKKELIIKLLQIWMWIMIYTTNWYSRKVLQYYLCKQQFNMHVTINRVVSAMAFVLTLWATVSQFFILKHNVHHDMGMQCPTAKTGLIGGAGFMSLNTALMWYIVFMLSQNRKEDIFDEEYENHYDISLGSLDNPYLGHWKR